MGVKFRLSGENPVEDERVVFAEIIISYLAHHNRLVDLIYVYCNLHITLEHSILQLALPGCREFGDPPQNFGQLEGCYRFGTYSLRVVKSGVFEPL